MEKEHTTKMFVVSTKIFVDDEIVVLNAVLWASAGLRPFDLLRSPRPRLLRNSRGGCLYRIITGNTKISLEESLVGFYYCTGIPTCYRILPLGNPI
jgi:hypothetical protein